MSFDIFKLVGMFRNDPGTHSRSTGLNCKKETCAPKIDTVKLNIKPKRFMVRKIELFAAMKVRFSNLRAWHQLSSIVVVAHISTSPQINS